MNLSPTLRSYGWKAIIINGARCGQMVFPRKKSPVTLPLKKNLRHGRKPLRPASVTLYHWTHLELKYYFNIDDTLNSRNWHEIMTRCNEQLRRKEFLPQALIRRSNVEALCTTDGPLDNLEYHQRLAANSDFSPLVLPTFRPDELFDTDPESFQTFISRLAEKTQIRIASLQDLLAALESRIDFSTL